jgi:uncharacterized protein DUF6176
VRRDNGDAATAYDLVTRGLPEPLGTRQYRVVGPHEVRSTKGPNLIQVAVRHINSENVEVLRAWLDQVGGPRRDEAIATLVDEGVSHEMVLLIKGSDAPVVIYFMEVEDPDKAHRAYETSEHPIDAEHRQVMSTVLGGPVESEILLDLRRGA